MVAAIAVGASVNLLPNLPVSPAGVVTESVPKGLYLIHREPAHLERGTMASFIYQAPAWAADRRYSNNPQFAKYVLGVPDPGQRGRSESWAIQAFR